MKQLYALILLLVGCGTSFSQVIVDGKNLNDDRDIEYLQISFHYEPRQLNPIYVIDYGTILASIKDVKQQKISLNNQEVNGSMTPVYILNQLYKAGWEYTGDGLYVKAPIFENSQIYTFRRKKDDPLTTTSDN